MQFEGKSIIQTQENGLKPHFGPDLGPFFSLNFLQLLQLHPWVLSHDNFHFGSVLH